jgi:hypothetical protein
MNRPNRAAIRSLLRKPAATRVKLVPHARWVLLEIVAAGALFVVVAAVAAAFSWPWRSASVPGGPTLARYLPLRDGSSRLVARYDSQGQLESWTSSNLALPPWLGVSGTVRKAASDLLLRTYITPEDGEIPFQELQRRLQARGQISSIRESTLDPAGRVAQMAIVNVREAAGERLVGVYTAEDNVDALYDPPALMLPSDLEPGRTWQTEGTFGSAQFRWFGRVAEAGPFAGQAGSFDDCLRVESRVTLTRGGTTTRDLTSSDWFCDGVGIVDTTQTEAVSGQTNHDVLLAHDGAATVTDPKPPAPSLTSLAADVETAPRAPDTLELARVGRARTTFDAGESTISARYAGDSTPKAPSTGRPPSTRRADASTSGPATAASTPSTSVASISGRSRPATMSPPNRSSSGTW